jgi:membrane protein implicated in regulation of membrane protease activity
VVLVGAVLLVLCVILAVGMYFPNAGAEASAAAFGVSLSNVSVGGLFLTGVAVGALAVLGLALIALGSTRKRHKNTAHKREVSSARGEQETLAEENARLQAELERQRAAAMPAEPVDEAARRRR